MKDEKARPRRNCILLPPTMQQSFGLLFHPSAFILSPSPSTVQRTAHRQPWLVEDVGVDHGGANVLMAQ